MQTDRQLRAALEGNHLETALFWISAIDPPELLAELERLAPDSFEVQVLVARTNPERVPPGLARAIALRLHDPERSAVELRALLDCASDEFERAHILLHLCLLDPAAPAKRPSDFEPTASWRLLSMRAAALLGVAPERTVAMLMASPHFRPGGVAVMRAIDLWFEQFWRPLPMDVFEALAPAFGKSFPMIARRHERRLCWHGDRPAPAPGPSPWLAPPEDASCERWARYVNAWWREDPERARAGLMRMLDRVVPGPSEKMEQLATVVGLGTLAPDLLAEFLQSGWWRDTGQGSELLARAGHSTHVEALGLETSAQQQASQASWLLGAILQQQGRITDEAAKLIEVVSRGGFGNRVGLLRRVARCDAALAERMAREFAVHDGDDGSRLLAGYLLAVVEGMLETATITRAIGLLNQSEHWRAAPHILLGHPVCRCNEPELLRVFEALERRCVDAAPDIDRLVEMELEAPPSPTAAAFTLPSLRAAHERWRSSL